MNSPVWGWLFPLYLAAAAALPCAAADAWWSVPALRRLLKEPQATALAHWAGPDASKPAAAFLAVNAAGGGVRSIVSLNGRGVRFDGKVTAEGGEAAPITSLDVEGVRVSGWVVMFHTEAGLLRSAFSFDTGKTQETALRYVITGVAPGVWEVWRNGWVVDPGVTVRAGEGVLYFEERPGSFFVRRLQ